MKCPLRHIEWKPNEVAKKREALDCIKEECAWWDSEVECCSIKSHVLELATISEQLAGIKERLPEAVKE